VSLLPAIRGAEQNVERDYIYFNHSGNAALRVGDWKILYTKTGEPNSHAQAEQSTGTAGWSLYDMSTDRCEQIDLAEKQPEKLKEMLNKWRELNQTFRNQESRND
jgi:arylsulfatase